MLGLKLAVKIIPQPQPLIFTGKDSSLDLTQLIVAQNVAKVLIVTDSVLNKLGIADKLCAKLAENDIDFICFDQVTPDPSEAVVMAGIKTAKDNNCDLVLGIGGGSSIDAAKMIAVLAPTTKSVKNVAGMLKIRRRGLPLYVLPTTSGTGSEVTMAAVITDTVNESKSVVISPNIIPLATALDPILMKGMPAKITADTTFDALTHALEAYLSTQANPQTNLYAITAIKLIFKYLPVAFKDGENIEAREALAVASCYGGLAFTKAGLGYVHAISHQLGAKYHLPHGMTNAIVLPHILTLNLEVSAKRLAYIASEIELPSENITDLALAQLFVDNVKALQSDMGIASSIEQIQHEDINDLAKAALKEAHYLYPVPKYINLAQCETIIKGLMPNTSHSR